MRGGRAAGGDVIGLARNRRAASRRRSRTRGADVDFEEEAQIARDADPEGEWYENVMWEIEGEVYGMAGNAGQESIIDENFDIFRAWTREYVRSGGREDHQEFMLFSGMAFDKYEGTQEIWTAAADIFMDAYETPEDYGDVATN